MFANACGLRVYLSMRDVISWEDNFSEISKAVGVLLPAVGEDKFPAAAFGALFSIWPFPKAEEQVGSLKIFNKCTTLFKCSLY